jgi:ABC-2 type transport system ATP-binding protein
VLILDEPTAGLDPNQAREFRRMMRALGSSHAILLSTHLLSEAIEVCDRVIILHRGRIVAMDRPDRLTAGPGAEGRVVLRVRMATRPLAEMIAAPSGRRIPMRVESLDAAAGIWRISGRWEEQDASAVLSGMIAQGATVLEWRMGSSSLEEVFQRLTLGESEEDPA